jgi:hypothetical protein
LIDSLELHDGLLQVNITDDWGSAKSLIVARLTVKPNEKESERVLRQSEYAIKLLLSNIARQTPLSHVELVPSLLAQTNGFTGV